MTEKSLPWTDLINTDIYRNIGLAYDCVDLGLRVPDTRFFRKMSIEEKEELLADSNWFEVFDLKGDSTGMAMERIRGQEATFHIFCQNGKISCRTISINASHLLVGDLGPNIGDNACTMFTGTSPAIEPILDFLMEKASKGKPYLGFISLTVTYRDGIPHYKRILYGFTNKLVFTILELFEGGIQTFFLENMHEARCRPIDGYAATLRVYAHPYLDYYKFKTAGEWDIDLEANQSLNVTGCNFWWDGESFIAHAKGHTISETWRQLYRSIPRDETRSFCYRTDGDSKPRRIVSLIMPEKFGTKIIRLKPSEPQPEEAAPEAVAVNT